MKAGRRPAHDGSHCGDTGHIEPPCSQIWRRSALLRLRALLEASHSVEASRSFFEPLRSQDLGHCLADLEPSRSQKFGPSRSPKFFEVQNLVRCRKETHGRTSQATQQGTAMTSSDAGALIPGVNSKRLWKASKSSHGCTGPETGLDADEETRYKCRAEQVPGILTHDTENLNRRKFQRSRTSRVGGIPRNRGRSLDEAGPLITGLRQVSDSNPVKEASRY